MSFKTSFIYLLPLWLKVTIVCCETYYEIGIYSNCTGKANRTQLNIDAGLVSDFNRDMMKSVQSYYKTNYKPKSQSENEFIYQVYDVLA